jgi:hypothetical protein
MPKLYIIISKKINRDIIFIKSRNIGKDTSTITQYLTAEIEKTISNSQWQNRKEKRKEKKERKRKNASVSKSIKRY